MEQSKKILVVDDETMISEAVKMVLERADFSVETHERAKSALESFEKNPDFDLVLTDIMMPGMSGIELAAEIRKICAQTRNNVPIIFMSGTPWTLSDEIGEEAAEKEILLEKPFDLAVLRKTIEEILDKNDDPASE